MIDFSNEQMATIQAYHRLFRHHLFCTDGEYLPTYRGVKIMKYPNDIWLLQEIVYKTKPDYIIEVGTLYGGTALFLSDVCDALGHGHIITVDNGELLGYVPAFPGRKRITAAMGDCAELYPKVKQMAHGNVMVILDCCHAAEHVLGELKTYGSLVTPGCYLVVDDTDLHGIGSETSSVPGPHVALTQFLASNSEFEQDLTQHKFLITTNPGGYLRRK